MDTSEKIFAGFVCTLASVLVGFLIYMACFVRPEHKAERTKEAAEWAAKGCPVYKAHCGSEKLPYDCERHAVAVGRNQIGDIFVNAYPICKVEK